jgi:hypothetical protein
MTKSKLLSVAKLGHVQKRNLTPVRFTPKAKLLPGINSISNHTSKLQELVKKKENMISMTSQFSNLYCSTSKELRPVREGYECPNCRKLCVEEEKSLCGHYLCFMCKE